MGNGNDYGGSNAASLGCGTLIIIALIVIFFSGPSIDNLEEEVATLRQEVVELRTDVEALQAEAIWSRQTLINIANEVGAQPASYP